SSNFFFFRAEDGIRDKLVTGVQTCALPIYQRSCTPDGTRVFVTLSGSPRVAPGVDENRAPADKSADGLGVIDPVTRKLIDRWHRSEERRVGKVCRAAGWT